MFNKLEWIVEILGAIFGLVAFVSFIFVLFLIGG